MTATQTTTAPAKPAAKAKPAPKAHPKAKAPAPKAETAAPPPALVDETLQTLPLAKLWLAPENARFGTKPEISDLLVSIPGAGRLIEPLHAYPEGDEFKVWDGGRRLAALKALASGKGKEPNLPPALHAGIPCLVSPSKEAARLASLVTFVRLGLNPAEEFLAYKELFDAGRNPGEIAAACNVGTQRVKQLLRLNTVTPEVLDALRQGVIPLDVAEAFSITDDHERQRNVLKAFNPKRDRAWDVRAALRKGAVSPEEPFAKLVGRKAYEAAGGRFLLDLFQRGDQQEWLDGDLARQLAQNIVDGKVAELSEQGWGEIRVIHPHDYSYRTGFEKGEAKSDEDKARATMFLKQDYEGQLSAEGPFFKAKKAASNETTTGTESRAKTDPARFGFTHGGHTRLTVIATEATKVALIRKPDAAYDAMLSHLAWVTFADRSLFDTTASRLAPDHTRRNSVSVTVNGSEEFDTAFANWKARLPTKDRVAFCHYVAALPDDEKAHLLAVSFATTLHAGEEKTDYHKPARWSHLGWMAQRAGVKIEEAWTPDEAFLKGASRPAIVAALRELGDKEKALDSYSKGTLLARLKERTTDKPWTPKLLATLTAIPAPGKSDDMPDHLKRLAGIKDEAPASDEPDDA